MPITGGKSQGVKINDVFNLVEKGKTVRNPQTGLDIQLPGKPVGRFQVVAQAGQGNNEISLGRVTEGSIKGLALTSIIVQEAH